MEQMVIRKIGILRLLAQFFFLGRSLAEKHPANSASLGREALVVASLGLGAATWQRDKHMDKIMQSSEITKQEASAYSSKVALENYAENPLHGTAAVVVHPQPIDHAALMMDIH